MRNRIVGFVAFVIILFFAVDRLCREPLEISTLGLEKLYPFEDHFLQKQYPETRFHISAFEKAMSDVLTFIKNKTHRSAGFWEVQGPGNIGARANSVAVDPKNPQIMFIGFSEGGLFRTQNGGSSWEAVFDEQTKLSIGEVVIDPINSKIIYVGTGDPNISGYPFIGDGVYKSVDGGNTWQNIGLKETRIISQIRISKANHDVIYVSAMGLPFEKNNHRGVYKSVNGGVTWKQVLQVNDSTGISDMVMHPQNPDILFATSWNRIRNNKKSLVSGPDARIYKTVDGGVNWFILDNGLPLNNSSRIGIDISVSNPEVLYACYAHPTSFNLKGVYKSVNGGFSWVSLPLGPDIGLEESIYGGFGWYFGAIRINPKDENDVFILAVDLYRTKNGGQNWQSAAPPWWTYDVHADKHDLIFNDNKMYLTTDGGVYKAEVGEENWEDIENIPTTQFYRVGYNANDPQNYFGGAQDNGTSGGNYSTIDTWSRIYGGDGFQPVFHPSDPEIFYAETQNGGLVVTKDGGKHFDGASFGIEGTDPRNWDMPYLMSYHNPDVLYTGTNRVYTNLTGTAIDWKPISTDLTDPFSNDLRHNISALHESPVDPGYLVVGTSDGLLWISEDKGNSWANVSDGLPKKYVSSVSFSSSASKTLYVSYSGYRDNDNTPYIFRSLDLGKSWQGIQGNLPLIAVNNILCLKPTSVSNNDLIVVATDAGVFYTSDKGAVWQRLGNNMPLVAVYDVEYNPIKNQIVAGTFGRSIMTFDLNQINYPDGVNHLNYVSNFDFNLKSTLLASDNNLRGSAISDHFKNVSYHIYDSSGKLLMQGIIDCQEFEIDVSKLNTGVFLLSLETKNFRRIYTKKFVKIL